MGASMSQNINKTINIYKVKFSRKKDDYISYSLCFSSSPEEAKKLVLEHMPNKSFSDITDVQDVTEKYVNEDGVADLCERGFVGVPKVGQFMLHGCMSSMDNHYNVKKRTAMNFWSDEHTDLRWQ